MGIRHGSPVENHQSFQSVPWPRKCLVADQRLGHPRLQCSTRADPGRLPGMGPTWLETPPKHGEISGKYGKKCKNVGVK